MTFESMARDIARAHGTTLHTLRQRDNHRWSVGIRRAICAALKKAGASNAQVGSVLYRDPSIVHSLMNPQKHRLRCKVYMELRRAKQDETEQPRKSKEDFHIPLKTGCIRCGLRGEHVCLTGDATLRREAF